MKMIENAYTYGIELREARTLTEEEKVHYNPEYQEHIVIGLGDSIELPNIKAADLADLKGREWYQFDGCSNMAYEITDEEWAQFVALNESREAAKQEKAKQEEIRQCEKTIAKAEAQKSIPTAAEAKKIIRNYNNTYNEGGEGYVPTIITAEQYERAKQRLAELTK